MNHPDEPSGQDRATLVARLRRADVCDLAIIGGGATGLAIALQAARAGRSVVLVEAGDFAGGTSSRSTKLLHGGVRYLAQGQLALVREALHERTSLIDLDPRVSHPLRFVMPAYRWWQPLLYGAGLLAYDWLAGSASLGPTRYLSRQKTLERYPQLQADGLRGAVSYCDAQFDDAGLAIAMARGASQSGALLINRMRALAVTRADSVAMHTEVADEESGERYAIVSRDVINAAGVWVDALRQAAPMVQPSQGAHIVVARSFFPADEAVLWPQTADGRVLFMVPWLNHCVIGTTDTPRDPADVALGREPLPFSAEIDLILAETGKVLRRAPTRADVLSAWAGLRPLVKPRVSNTSGMTAGTTAQISREHAIEIAANGLLTITGGKWTTCLAMARDALRALPHRPLALDGSPTGPLPADGPICAARAPTDEEVDWLVHHAWARTVEDVLARRSRLLFLDVRAALAAAPAVARALERATGRDPDLDGFRLLGQTWLGRFRND